MGLKGKLEKLGWKFVRLHKSYYNWIINSPTGMVIKLKGPLDPFIKEQLRRHI